MPRKPATSLARSAALQGNQRAVKEPAAKVEGRSGMKLSISTRRRERLRAAMIAQEGGGWPSNDEVDAMFRVLAYGGVDAYIARAERDHGEAMIL